MYYTITAEKLDAVTELVQRDLDPKATRYAVAETICADWHEGDEHQEWIDSATAQEIFDWMVSFTD